MKEEKVWEKTLDLDKVFSIVKKNWLVIKRDKARLIPMLMFPFIMILIYGSTAGSTIKHVPAAIVDYDNTPYSQQLAQAVYSADVFTVKKKLGSQDEGKRMLDSGQISLLFVIPQGFGNSVSSGKPAKVSVLVDESNPTTAQVSKSFSQALVNSFSLKMAQERMKLISQNLEGVGLKLQQGKNSLHAVPSSFNSSSDIRIKEIYSASASSARTLSASILQQQNSIGYVADPNVILYSLTLPNSSVNPESGATVARQQQALAQIAYYSGLKLAFMQITHDSALIYSDLALMRLKNEKDNAANLISVKLIDSAGNEIRNAEAGLQSVNSPVLVNFVEPYGAGRSGLDFLLPNILALIIFQGAAAGLGRAIAGERENGSLTRVFLTPTSNVSIIVGTQLFYFVVEAFRSMIIVFAAILFYGVTITGSLIDVLIIIGVYGVGATGVGMILSVMAKTQEQYQAISLIVILPTIFLSGVFFPIETLPPLLQGFANVLPMAYAAHAFSGVMVKGFGVGQLIPDLSYLAVFGIITVAVSLMLFKRELV